MEILLRRCTPFVIKLTNSTGSEKTRMIHDEQMVKQFMDDSAGNPAIALVEESYIQGKEYCVDGL
ncbi:hypothetical protein [Bartonella sp. B30(2025)]